MEKEQDKCLAPDYYTLILAVSVHVRVTVIADGEYVRRQLADFTILVQLDLFRGINGQYLIRVDGDQDGARVCLKNVIVYVHAGSDFARLHILPTLAPVLRKVSHSNTRNNRYKFT